MNILLQVVLGLAWIVVIYGAFVTWILIRAFVKDNSAVESTFSPHWQGSGKGIINLKSRNEVVQIQDDRLLYEIRHVGSFETIPELSHSMDILPVRKIRVLHPKWIESVS